jgi:hypothetical protein
LESISEPPKNTGIKKQGMYTPLPIPNKPWESILMDYMLGLLSTKKGNDYVFVDADQFSKMAILVVCKKSITTEAITKLFFKRVWVHFGLPQTIVSDWDNHFLNKLGQPVPQWKLYIQKIAYVYAHFAFRKCAYTEDKMCIQGRELAFWLP